MKTKYIQVLVNGPRRRIDFVPFNDGETLGEAIEHWIPGGTILGADPGAPVEAFLSRQVFVNDALNTRVPATTADLN